MQVIVLACLLAVAAAASLENTYLPPQNARGAGGRGNFLSGPLTGAATAPGANLRNAYNAPQSNRGASTAGAYSGSADGAHRSAEASARILRFDNDNDGLGSYSYNFETENGIQAQEAGELKNIGAENGIVKHGKFSWTGPDGMIYAVEYLADENGFQPVGAHLPTPPPIPEAILRSLEHNAAEEAAASRSGGGSGGQYHAQSSTHQATIQQAFNSQSGYKY